MTKYLVVFDEYKHNDKCVVLSQFILILLMTVLIKLLIWSQKDIFHPFQPIAKISAMFLGCTVINNEHMKIILTRFSSSFCNT